MAKVNLLMRHPAIKLPIGDFLAMLPPMRHPQPKAQIPSSAQGATANHTAATIATCEAIVTATDETDTLKRAKPESAHLQDPTEDHAIKVVHQRQQLQVSAITPSFDEAITRIGLDVHENSHAVLHPPNTFQIPPTFLKPWQVTAVAWMLDQEASPLHGGLLADACGLGKTISALTLIWTANQPSLPVDPTRTFAPSLILVPNALVDTWVTEIDRHFGDALTLVLLFGSSTRTGDRRRKALTISKLTDLQSTLDGLDPSNPATGTTVVLSSYQTWARRTTRVVDLEGNPVHATRQRTGTSRHVADPKAKDPNAEEEEFDEDVLTDVEEEPIYGGDIQYRLLLQCTRMKNINHITHG
ncbi:Helicase C-terminal [Penicillium canescens]|nr:Helicase C-terminal [Penicillium canescens]